MTEAWSLLRKGMTTGIEYIESTKKPCTAYIKDKQHRLLFDSSGRIRANDFLEIIHADICGPFPGYIGQGLVTCSC